MDVRLGARTTDLRSPHNVGSTLNSRRNAVSQQTTFRANSEVVDAIRLGPCTRRTFRLWEGALGGGLYEAARPDFVVTSRACARSEIPGWHDRALYPLAGRRAAPPDFFLALAVAAELRGRRRRRRLAPAR